MTESIKYFVQRIDDCMGPEQHEAYQDAILALQFKEKMADMIFCSGCCNYNLNNKWCNLLDTVAKPSDYCSFGSRKE